MEARGVRGLLTLRKDLLDANEELRENRSQVKVTHSCNPSYSGGRDVEDHSSKPAWENRDPISNKNKNKKTITAGVTQGVRP
jgi:hypothetical protein